MSRQKIIYLFLSLGLSILLIAILFSRIEVEDFAQTLARIFIPALLAYMAIAVFGAALRAWRYRLFLSPQKIRWRDILMATFIRNSFVDLLPARIGSLSLIYILNKRLGFSFESAASVFVASFVYDFLSLGPFIIAAVFAVGWGAVSLSSPALLAMAGLFFLVWLFILLRITWFFTILIGIFRATVKLFRQDKKRWAAVSIEKLQATIDSLDIIQKKKRAVPFFLLSLAIRSTKYISLYFLLFALLRSLGFGLESLSFWKLILGTTGAELTSILPVRGLAGFGTWESAWALTLGMMSFDRKIAILSGLGVHLITNVFEYSLGIGSLIILAFPFLRRKMAERDTR